MKRGRSQSLALVVAAALFASACGGEHDSMEGSDALVGTTTTTAVDGPAADVPATEEVSSEAAAVQQMPEVLAFAVEAANTESFTFTQGLALQLNAEGSNAPASPPYAFGGVDGDQLHVLVDVETFVGESLGILRGMGPEAPVGEQFEYWADGSTLTLDVSELTLDDDAPGEASTGPVSIDLSSAPNITTQSVVRQLGRGSVITDPSTLLDSLAILEEAEELAVETIDEISVTGYRAEVRVADYYQAQGSTVADQLGVLDAVGFEGADGDALAAMAPQIEQSQMVVTAYLDADGRLRRLTTDLELTDVVVSYLESSPALADEVGASSIDLGSMFGPDGLQIVVSSWQSFSDYGSAQAIIAPEAVDVTGEESTLFG